MKNNKKEIWKEAASQDIRYEDEFSYLDLLKWIKESVPKNTPPENIQIKFDIEEQWDYYDTMHISAYMRLLIKE